MHARSGGGFVWRLARIGFLDPQVEVQGGREKRSTQKDGRSGSPKKRNWIVSVQQRDYIHGL